MNNLMLATQKIKDTISAQDIGEALGLEIRHGRCQCPLHGGNDFNCVLYKGSRGFYCHVCKSGGDVIKFVQQYYKSSFKDSVSWINDTFHLGLDLDRKMDPAEAKRAEIALQKRKREREFQAWKDRMQFDLALAADQIVEKLEKQRDLNAPKTADEPWNRMFCQAVRLLPVARRYAEELMFNCIEVRKND